MNTGAVALIDAMGFRGIWGRHNSDDVLAALRKTKDWFEHRIEEQFRTQPSFRCEVAFLSDTIAVSMALDQSAKNREALSAIYLGDVISWVLDLVLRSNVPLAYRGAIAVGNYEVSPHFLIGQAIDEAAAAHELAQGAFIWLTPAARDHVALWLKDKPRNTHFVRYDVPLKGGDTFNTYTVSPLMQAHGQNDADAQTQTLLGTFSNSSMDVAIKRQNTANHMRACYAWKGLTFPAELSTL